jgi:hypothetical protein
MTVSGAILSQEHNFINRQIDSLPNDKPTEVDLRDKQSLVSQISGSSIHDIHLNIQPKLMAQSSLNENPLIEIDKIFEFFKDSNTGVIIAKLRTGTVFATAGNLASVPINNLSGVSSTPSWAMLPATYAKSVAILPINEFKPTQLVGNDRKAQTAVQVGLNIGMAKAGIELAKFWGSRPGPVLAQPSATRRNSYAAAIYIPIANYVKNDVMSGLEARGVVPAAGDRSKPPKDVGQWVVRYVPDSIAVSTGVGAAVATTIGTDSVVESLKKGIPINFKVGSRAILNKGGLAAAITFGQVLLANGSVNHVGSSSVVDGAVNGGTGRAIGGMTKKIFFDPQQRASVDNIKREA